MRKDGQRCMSMIIQKRVGGCERLEVALGVGVSDN